MKQRNLGRGRNRSVYAAGIREDAQRVADGTSRYVDGRRLCVDCADQRRTPWRVDACSAGRNHRIQRTTSNASA